MFLVLLQNVSCVLGDSGKASKCSVALGPPSTSGLEKKVTRFKKDGPLSTGHKLLFDVARLGGPGSPSFFNFAEILAVS